MGKLIDFEAACAELPHYFGQSICRHCAHGWVAVYPAYIEVPELECPSCGEMTPSPHLVDDDGDQ